MKNSQLFIYSVDTSSFYTDREKEISKEINNIKELKLKATTTEDKRELNSNKKKLQKLLYSEFDKNPERQLNEKALNKYHIISVFPSILTRTLEMEINQLSTNIIIVETYFYQVVEQLIKDGFMFNDEKYIMYTASAGQIRAKKIVFIKECLFNKYSNTLMCGLTIDHINKKGGINVNKYLAYLALTNSTSDEWDNFDISKSIVVDDLETDVHGTVDIINDITYSCTRETTAVPINQTDGCGMMLPSISKKNMMVRLPWIKGLMASFDFKKFILEYNGNDLYGTIGIVKDIYGIEHDIIKEDIQIIFTKSQFKLCKFYADWADYQYKFKLWGCSAAKCKIEKDIIPNGKLNYQVLQSLTDMTVDELAIICKTTNDKISKLANDRPTQLKVFGCTPENIQKDAFQKALEIYPELLQDCYTKTQLKEMKQAMVNDALCGKVDVNGKYTFILPDLFAFCEHLFLGIKEPTGLLQDGEVSCRLFSSSPKLDCLRSPHLYREHAVRNNISNSSIRKWFNTDACYTSTHDLISKILQFDVDGDCSLVVADKTIIEVAERNMQGIVPLYYKMRNADKAVLDSNTIFNGLKSAWNGGNIGYYSNSISKIWNSNSVNLEAVKLLVMENNFSIDYAKTLYKPTRPKGKNELLSIYTKTKLPHFFKYAKDKKDEQIEEINDIGINKLKNIIYQKRLVFLPTSDKFNYKILMSNSNIIIDQRVIRCYKSVIQMIKKETTIDEVTYDNGIDLKGTNYYKLLFDSFNLLTSLPYTIIEITDMLVEYLYNSQSNFKMTLWLLFGDAILANIASNMKVAKTCTDCSCLFIAENYQVIRCTECKEIHMKVLATERKRKSRMSKASYINSKSRSSIIMKY